MKGQGGGQVVGLGAGKYVLLPARKPADEARKPADNKYLLSNCTCCATGSRIPAIVFVWYMGIVLRRLY